MGVVTETGHHAQESGLPADGDPELQRGVPGLDRHAEKAVMVSPFPVAWAVHLYGWMRENWDANVSDEGPQTLDEVTAELMQRQSGADLGRGE